MKLHYVDDTDTLYIEFRTEGIVETRDLDDDTVLDLDEQGRICAITMERASHRTDLPAVKIDGLIAA